MEPNPIQNLNGAFWYVRKYLSIAKPELIPEWMEYWGKSGNEMVDFLDKYFPVPDGWLSRNIKDTREILMEFHPYPQENPNPKEHENGND